LTKSFFVDSKDFHELFTDFSRFNFPNNCDKFFKESKRNQEKIFTTDGELSIYLSGLWGSKQICLRNFSGIWLHEIAVIRTGRHAMARLK